MKNKIIKAAVSIVLIFLAFWLFSEKNIFDKLLSVDGLTLAIALVVLFISLGATSIRFAIFLKEFDIDFNMRTAHFVNIMSQFLSLLTIPILTQMISRAGFATYVTRHAQRMFFLTLLEKSLSLFSLLIMAMIGGYLIFWKNDINTPIPTAEPILVSIGIIIIAIVISWRVAIMNRHRRYLKKIASLLRKTKLEYAFLVSIFVHLLTLTAYTTIAKFFLPEESIIFLASIFSLVMLSSAIPISFVGFGIRELSAGLIFSALSLNPAIGFLTALLVGLLSIVCLGIHILLNNAFITLERNEETQRHRPKHIKLTTALHFESLAIFLCGLLIAAFIGAQVVVETGGGVALNLADPIAICATLTFIGIHFLHYKPTLTESIWRIPHFNFGLILFAIMIIIGWGIGYVEYGGNKWATNNRLVGLLILFSYIGAGASFVAFFDRKQLIIIVKIMIIIALTAYIVFVLSLLFDLLPSEVLHKLYWYPSKFNGLLYNRNAFALQMLLALSVMLSFPKSSEFKYPNLWIGLVIFLIISSSSRTAIFIIFSLIFISLWLRLINYHRIIKIIGCTFFIIIINNLILTMLPLIHDPALNGLINISSNVSNLTTHLFLLDYTTIQSDRLKSLIDGFNMWIENPIFGGGLGAFIESQGLVPLVIHNTVLWVLAEMGLFGLALFLVLPFSIAKHNIRKGIFNMAWEDAAMLLLLFTVITFSQLHEITYQRAIWFFIGMLATKNKLFHSRLSP